ncbi:MAG: DNA-directed RNA polymerase subunit beta' [Thiomargarita sp.]|nr:DNA-directed RNA polymerase subunit beta' [Thiomargarita sp.]
MENLFELFSNLSHIKDFDRICISIASPEKIRSWSYGEIETSDTINYRSLKPENNGLFCAKTFGPIKDYECLCGKYKLLNHQGIVCDKCGVEATLAKVRRERMGHIELAAPIAHFWYFKSLPSRIGLLLDLSLRDLERIIYFDAYIVIEPGSTRLKRGELLSEKTYFEALETYGNEFDARMGAEAIDLLLRATDLMTLKNILYDQINLSHSETLKKRLRKRLILVQSLLHSHTKPEWMVLKVLPVLPPDLRPLVSFDSGRFISSDLNDLYRRVINRNNRTKRLLKLKVPEVIIRNELRMLQESVDALLDNGRRHRSFTGINKLSLHSLSDMIKGKQGRFRQNLLGKRVDYSGRSVIVVEPRLKWHQCGLPKEMAVELFKPFLFHLMQKRLAISIKTARKLVEERKPEIWKILEEVVREHPVLLNLMPTLSRLGIQAFEPILIEGKAIQLHPLVGKVFNALFDGEQMVVHIPLTIEAQLESRVLMMSKQNLLSPVNSTPLIMPSLEMILGLYVITSQRAKADGEGKIFADINEVERAYENGVVNLQASIQLLLKENAEKKRVKTTVGRAILSQCLPKKLPFDLINRPLTKKTFSELIHICYLRHSLKETIIFADQLMHFGFTLATRLGISFNLDDMPIAKQKRNLINKAKTQVNQIQKKYLKGLITNSQRDYNILNIWAKTKDKITDATLKTLSKSHKSSSAITPKTLMNSTTPKKNMIENILSLMIKAGVQNVTEISHLAGMRGLMIKPNGSIIKTPITANFREGLDIHQYFMTTSGTRKELMDSTFKGASAGYLTRRLVDVAQDVIITEQDCGTNQGITLKALMKEGQTIISLSERLLGRIVADDIFILDKKKPITNKNTLLDEKEIARILLHNEIKQVKVRSPITCESQNGLCAMCYGYDLARLQLINIGEAIGVIAAQSIGESCKKLIARSPSAEEIVKKLFDKSTDFSQLDAIINVDDDANMGNIVSKKISNTYNIIYGLPRIADLFEARIPKKSAILAPRSGTIHFGKETKIKYRIIITDKNGQQDEFVVQKGRNFKVFDGQQVQFCDVIVDGELNPHDILSLKGLNEFVNDFINEMQEIYILHGISINDKHFEIILRQMLQTVTIENPGDTLFLSENIVKRTILIQENQRVIKNGGLMATCQPNLLGITKASLSTESYISAASFMDTTRVLLNSAVNNKCDELRGVKENVIIGRLIPAGTGL